MRKAKRRRTRARRKGPSLSRVPRIRGPIPNSMIVNMDYHEVGTKTAVIQASGYAVLNVWNSNSIFDPNQTGAGHQPRFHDEWARLYRKYYVRKCTMTMRVHTTTGTNDSGGYMFVERKGANDVTKIAINVNLQNLLEQQKSSNGKVTVRRFGAMGGGRSKWITHKMTTIPAFDIEGRDKSDMTATFGSNPSRLTNIITMWTFPQRSADLTFFFEVDLKYEVILMDPIMPEAS